MKKYFLVFTSLLLIFVSLSTVQAGNKAYIYRSRANWVKVDTLTKKQLAGVVLNHPYTNVSAEEMEAMLLSIKLSKGSVFKKEVNTEDVFNEIEARKIAAHIVTALSQAAPHQVVNVSIVHKRPYFILRNDYLSNINIYVTDQGIHFYFNKLFARLDNDYEQASNLTESISKAKSLRVSLQALAGQTLSQNGSEIVMNVEHDYASDVAAEMQKKEAENKQLLKAKNNRKSGKDAAALEPVEDTKEVTPPKASPKVVANSNSSSSASQDVKVRLQKLEELRKSNLITDSEYQTKKKEILSDL